MSCESHHGGWPLVAVIGPTGSGKSELGLTLAEAVGGEIVNCDSIQVYKGLNIGSAKVPEDARKGIAHHLLDVIGPDEELTAGAYARLARQATAEIRGKGRVPVVVGGTGFYLKALLDGLSPAPLRDQHVRERLEGLSAQRPGALHRFLRRFDRPTGARIHPNDRQKLIRAVEMILLARRPATETQAQARDALEGFAVLKVGLAPERTRLYEHLNRRSAALFERGLMEETKALLAGGIAARAKALQSLGYKQAVDVLEGRLTMEQAIAECQTKTRQYAKRQITWFRRERDVHWLAGFGWEQTVQPEAVALVRAFVAEHRRRS